MYKLYFELTRFDDAGQVVHSDSFLISLDESGLFSRLIFALCNLLKRRKPKDIFEEFVL